MGKFLLWWFKALLRLRNLERARQDSALLDWLPSREVNLVLHLGQDLESSPLQLGPSQWLAKQPYIHIGRRREQWYVMREEPRFIRLCDDFRAALALAATQIASQPDPRQQKEGRHAIPPQVHRS